MSNSQDDRTPLVSVIMGVYNCADTLPEALDSILAQTYRNLEIIVCEDGSSDNTLDVAMRYADKHAAITLVSNHKNAGLAHSLNRCLGLASGTLIARMDGDDVSLPHRFETQVQHLQDEPNIHFISSSMLLFDENGMWGRTYPPENPTKEDLAKKNVFAHAPTMIRRSVLETVGSYSEDPKHWRVEDYELWIRVLAVGFHGQNLAEPVYAMRDNRAATARRSLQARKNEARAVVQAVRMFGLRKWRYIWALRPIIIGLLPAGLYENLRRRHLLRSGK